MAPANNDSFSVSVVLPASGREIMANVRRRLTCWVMLIAGRASAMNGNQALILLAKQARARFSAIAATSPCAGSRSAAVRTGGIFTAAGGAMAIGWARKATTMAAAFAGRRTAASGCAMVTTGT